MWLEAIQIYSYNHVRSQLVSLQEQLELKQAHDPDLDVQMWRIRKGHHALGTNLVFSTTCFVLCSYNGLFHRYDRVTFMRSIFML